MRDVRGTLTFSMLLLILHICSSSRHCDCCSVFPFILLCCLSLQHPVIYIHKIKLCIFGVNSNELLFHCEFNVIFTEPFIFHILECSKWTTYRFKSIFIKTDEHECYAYFTLPFYFCVSIS